jgi:hypothetical protein
MSFFFFFSAFLNHVFVIIMFRLADSIYPFLKSIHAMRKKPGEFLYFFMCVFCFLELVLFGLWLRYVLRWKWSAVLGNE